MMYLSCDIRIENASKTGYYRFTKANRVRIETGINRLVSTASITLPNIKTFIGNPSELDRLLAVGSKVIIKLGYNDNNLEEFSGYISEKLPNVPFEIRCEDEMWLLRQTTITKAWSSITLKALLQYLVPNIELNPSVWDITLTDFRIDRANVVQVLDKLKESYGLVIYYRNGMVYASLPYANNSGNTTVVYHFQKNVIKSNLVFRAGDNYRLKVRAISMQPDNTKFEVAVGDQDGDTTTLHFYNLNRADLLKQAEQRLKVLKTVGYRGSILAFGKPMAKPGYIAQFVDANYPERQGHNFIDDVITEWGVNGFRRTITPGIKVKVNE